MRKKGWLLVAVAFVLGATLAWAQSSFPVRLDPWQEPTPPQLQTVATGTVALGEGALGLFPDPISITTIFSGSGSNIKFSDASCTDANRGEIRLLELEDGNTAGASKIDSLCFCRKYVLDNVVQPYAWSCLKVP